jgi:sugar O-acyltransferase (sialic acid O-acetyltransferase NeuD family)
MNDLLLVGGGGHCHSCIDVIETSGAYRIAGVVQPVASGKAPVAGYPVIGSDDELAVLVAKFGNALVTVGQIKSPDVRRGLYEKLRSLGAVLPVIASTRAHVSRRSEIAPGTIVMHGAVVNAGARIGENGIINSQALVEHDAVVGAHCHISTGARVNGGTVVGDGSFIGSGAVLTNGVTVGAGCIVSAGSVVLSDVPSRTLVRPAR